MISTTVIGLVPNLINIINIRDSSPTSRYEQMQTSTTNHQVQLSELQRQREGRTVGARGFEDTMRTPRVHKPQN